MRWQLDRIFSQIVVHILLNGRAKDMQSLLGIFGQNPEIHIKYHNDDNGGRGLHKRILSPNEKQVKTCELCPIIVDGDTIKGEVIIRCRANSAVIEQNGIYIELVGTVERRSEANASEPFISTKLQVASASEGPLRGDVAFVYPFDFGQVHLPFASYDGAALSLR